MAREVRQSQEERAAGSDVLLVDIGQDIGALVAFAGEDLVGHEIEIIAQDAVGYASSGVGHGHRHGPGEEHVHPLHNVVRRRQVGAHTYYAAVFPDLAAGTYRPYRDGMAYARPFAVTGGSVTEIDWPDQE